MSRDIPIIFSATMVRALLEGRKTQTRRILKPQLVCSSHAAWPDNPEPVPSLDADGVHCATCGAGIELDNRRKSGVRGIPVRYQVGDRLWVRENVWQASPYPGALPSGDTDESQRWCSRLVHYSADGQPPNTPNRHYPSGLREGSGAFSAPDPYAVWLQRPSIHMPRWASRLTLIATGVKVERLQDISEDDALAEGIEVSAENGTFGFRIKTGYQTARYAFMGLWMHLNGIDSWAENPEVVAVSFRVIKANIDEPEARVA